jgi:hypothetical protein
MPRTGKPATPLQVARYGHIAAAIRQALQARNMEPSELREQLGLPRNATTLYPWINGTGAPMPKYHRKLMHVLGLTKDQLIPRAENTVTLPGPPPTPTSIPRARAGDVLSFVVSAESTVRIKLDIDLPLEQGSALLRMLLDAGVVYSGGNKETRET